ncbi:MAG: thiamine pyrophosphate-binding protein, partial [Bryobacteraceae bacterium]
MPSGAELFSSALSQLGVSRIFTLVGDHLNEALAVAARSGIEITDMRHESGVTHAADAWARITRKPTVSLVTGGPGHTNSLTGIATAYLAASPLIAISGSRSTTMAERQGFQDIDQVGMTAPVVKWAAEPPNSAQIPFYLGRAFAEADSGRKGPVHLTIPVDLFTGKTDFPTRVPLRAETSACSPDSRDITSILDALRKAERPVVIAGSGIWWDHAEADLKEFIEATNLPLYTITMAKGVVPDDHPLCLGYADPALNQAVHQAFREADLFLVLGKRIDYRLAMGGPRLFPAHAQFIQVDIHPQELGMNRPLAVGVCAGVKATLRALLAEVGLKKWAPSRWLERLRELRKEWEERLAGHAGNDSSPIHPAAFYRE